MDIKNVHGFQELETLLKPSKEAYLLLYKSGSEQSDCALSNLSAVDVKGKDVLVMTADVKTVRDIHGQYGIKTVPVLLEYSGGQYVKAIKGCHDTAYYASLLQNTLHSASTSAAGEKKTKQVIIYTTPTCPHCNSAKQHLKINGIKFRDIDVSKDSQAAERMTRKSGQRGVPQLEIDGQMVVGFNKPKINELLGIN